MPRLSKLELALIEVGEFLHSEPHDYFDNTSYKKAKGEVMEHWWRIVDHLKAKDHPAPTTTQEA